MRNEIIKALEVYHCYVVSSGTLRSEDLYEPFLSLLQTMEPESYLVRGEATIYPTLSDAESAEPDFDWIGELVEALNYAAPEGYYFGSTEGDGACFGFWETDEQREGREWSDFEAELADIADGPLAQRGATLRTPRKVHLCGEAPAERFYVFAFGAYGDTYVAVGRPSWGHGDGMCEALEDAAACLADVAPGYFHKPDLQDAINEIAAEGGDTEDEDEIMDRACADLTYTESGYLASWEWTVVGTGDMSRADLLRFARGE